MRYNKEKPAGIKKNMYYLTILATELAAELNASVLAHPSAPMQFVLAYRQLKQAYEKPTVCNLLKNIKRCKNSNHAQDEAVAVRDIRDLRFMAEMFKRQGRLIELFELWDNPPPALKEVMSKHQSDLMSLKTRVLAEESKWDLLKDHCVACIEQAASQAENEPQRMWELCAWDWDVWKGLMDAVRQTGTTFE